MKNFHVPLTDQAYSQLRQEADRTKLPATSLAREAIDYWLRVQRRRARKEAIGEYAREMAGTRFDLDPELEAAGIEHLIESQRRSK